MIKVFNVIANGLNREGITTTQLEYMRHIDKEKFAIDIAAVNNDNEEVIAEFENLGCNVIRFPNRMKHLFKYRRMLADVIKKNNYDVIHVHGSSALLAIELSIAKKLNIPIRIAHSRNTSCKYKLLDKVLRPYFYKSYTKALACGKEAGEFLFGSHPFTIFYNGKDFDRFRFNENERRKRRTELGIESKYVIGFVGNLNEQKNPIFLLNVFEALKEKMDVHLVMVGDGPLLNLLQQYVKTRKLSSKVSFIGRVKNVNDYIQAFDLMLLPSLYEGLPNVVLEWQLSGLKSLISSNITKECKVTDLVEFLPIDQGVDVWVDRIVSINLDYNRGECSEKSCEQMRMAGFDIKASTKELEKLYSL